MKTSLISGIGVVGWLVLGNISSGQNQPEKAGTPAAKEEPSGGNLGLNKDTLSILKQTMPLFDPKSNTVLWDGNGWKLENNSLFRSQFLKYLNAPEETDEESLAYDQLLGRIQKLLTPGQSGAENIDLAWRTLFEASKFKADGQLCKDIADSIYALWQARKEQQHLVAANETLRKKAENLQRNMAMEVDDESLFDVGRKDNKQDSRQLKREIRLKPYITQLEETEAIIKANTLKREASELGAKIQLQTLIVQLFTQRRFEHVIITCRFYQAVYGEDQKLQVSDQIRALLTGSSGMEPTISVVTALTHDATQNVSEGVEAYLYHMQKGELQMATERLQEAYLIGQYLPAIKTLPRTDKRLGFEYIQKADVLQDAIAVKDYERAQTAVNEMGKMATDFNPTKPLAAIQTAATLSRMHLAKARAAASQNDTATLESELKAAAEIWPRNPELEKMSVGIFNQADLQQQAIAEFERLKSEKNYREIFLQRAKFIAASAMLPEKAGELEKILETMGDMELNIAQAAKIAQLGDFRGAWECLELAKKRLPNDNKLNEDRFNYATKIPDYVNALNNAAEREKSGDLGASLSWYLKAYAEYPSSQIASDGISKIVQTLYPGMKND